MQIKGMNGENYSVTGMGQGNLNTVLGAIGTAGALGNGNGLLGGLFGGKFAARILDEPKSAKLKSVLTTEAYSL